MGIKLGTIVVDLVTGLTGVAENRASYLYGCDRYYVQPRMKEDGTIPEGRMIDEPQLRIKTPEECVMTPQKEPKQRVKLGGVVRDPIKSKTGVATGRSVYLNGCSRVLVEAKDSGDNKENAWWVEEEQLEVVTGLLGGEKTAIERPINTTRTGGPARSSSKY